MAYWFKSWYKYTNGNLIDNLILQLIPNLTTVKNKTLITNKAHEDVIQNVQAWGELDTSISYVLQTDLNTLVQDNNSVPLKFFIGAKNPEQLIHQIGWLEKFGSTTKSHAANHGFCCLVKAAYDTGLKLNFIMVDTANNTSGYSHYNLNKLDSNCKLLVKK